MAVKVPDIKGFGDEVAVQKLADEAGVVHTLSGQLRWSIGTRPEELAAMREHIVRLIELAPQALMDLCRYEAAMQAHEAEQALAGCHSGQSSYERQQEYKARWGELGELVKAEEPAT